MIKKPRREIGKLFLLLQEKRGEILIFYKAHVISAVLLSCIVFTNFYTSSDYNDLQKLILLNF